MARMQQMPSQHGAASKLMAVATMMVAALCLCCAATVVHGSSSSSSMSSISSTPVLDCRFDNTPKNITIKIINDCGDDAKVRTCASKWQHCSGYKSQPNYFQVACC